MLEKIKKKLKKLFNPAKQTEPTDLRSTLLHAIVRPEQSDKSLTAEERLLLRNTLLLGESCVDDIMIPRAQIEALDLTSTLGEALEVFEDSGYSRLPIYDETLDDPRGMIHIRDILNYFTKKLLGNKNTAPINLDIAISELDIIRDVLFVPSSMLANKLLQKMQASRTQMALVIDEYGGTDGLVSLEDIVELIVGEIEDEHDEDTALIVKLPNGSFLADAGAELQEVKAVLGDKFITAPFENEVDTLGGLIVTKLGHIPPRGQTVEVIPGYRFRIVEADKRRIKRVRIKAIEDANQAQPPLA
ncbi:hemolysin family protein [Bartonella sp. TP]|uniref:hemolysin family protein n=1 Tax=Bartonella sp. TP TaxID=3057550 RepID=UPI0025B15FB5|nr:hemolysin family protein [Bartonella sp. TP]MDN5248567.1 hemolysin family protein [Alphaproteobacteria bacterium]WJW80391.1 hemolysin family protein [Bartonella sp. TP]